MYIVGDVILWQFCQKKSDKSLKNLIIICIMSIRAILFKISAIYVHTHIDIYIYLSSLSVYIVLS